MRVWVFLFLVFCSSFNPSNKTYPLHWWKAVPREQLRSWEISPDSVEPPYVILSKRNELGLLSNFAATPFVLDDKRYGSLEGFWQSLKYPEDHQDIRYPLARWPYKREDVEKMEAFEAKKAGDFGSKVMKKNNINWVTYQSKKMEYKEPGRGKFYQIIRRAMKAKVDQNPQVKEVLRKTGNLILLPDHKQGENPPEAWQYHKIYMEMRNSL